MAILSPDKVSKFGGVNVKEYLLTKHNPNRIAMPNGSISKPIAITIHNTDRLSSLTKGATEQAEQHTRATVNGNMNSVRVHYYVDENGAWQNLPLNLQGWHAADGNGDGNTKTIAIECIMSSKYTDIDKKSEDNAAKLIAALLKQYGLGIDALRTHTYWLHNCKKNGYGVKGSVDYMNTASHKYKNCPAYIIPHWANFKAKVNEYLTGNTKDISVETKTETTFSQYKVKVVCDELNVRKTPLFTDDDIVTTIKKNEVYTIVGEKIVNGVTFGKLKSGVGYISLKPAYVKKV